VNDDLLRAIRNLPGRRAEDLADALRLPRTNFGRPVTNTLRDGLDELVDAGLVEERRGRFRLSEAGRRALADRTLGF
jgi:DNA-binding PadR family transcriptional regulator